METLRRGHLDRGGGKEQKVHTAECGKDEPSSVHEVLELVLSCTSDAALLCKATSLSTHYQQLSLARIRQNLPEILVHTVKQAASTAAGLQRQVQDGVTRVQVKRLQRAQKAVQAYADAAIAWLCDAAGLLYMDAAGQQQVKAALLCRDLVVVQQITSDSSARQTVWAWQPYTSALAEGGLRLSEADLVSAARQQLPPLGLCMSVPKDSSRTWHLDCLLQAVLIDDAEHVLQHELLRWRPSGDRILGLLFVAANEGAPMAFRSLLNYGKQHTALLSGVPAAPASIKDSNSTSESPGLQQQLGQLVLTCLTAQHVDLVNLLVNEAPAVALLDTSQLTQLLKAAVLLGNQMRGHHSYGGSMFRTAAAALCNIPAAQHISGGELAGVVRLLLLTSTEPWHNSFHKLLSLPGARSWDDSQLCSLLRLARRTPATDIIRGLAELAKRQHMPHSTAMQLVSAVLDDQPVSVFVHCLGDMRPVKLWRCLTDAEFVEIMAQILQKSPRDQAKSVMTAAMYALHSNDRATSDAATCIKLVKAIIKHLDCTDPYAIGMFSDRVLAFKTAPLMTAQECTELLQYAIEQTGLVPSVFLKLPATKTISSEQVYGLMQLCMHKVGLESSVPHSTPNRDSEKEDAAQSPCLDALSTLARLPAACWLSVQQVADVTSFFMRQEGVPDSQGLPALLALPAVEHFGSGVAKGLVSAAVTAGSMYAINMLCQRSPTCAVAWEDCDPQLLAQHMQALLQAAGPDGLCLRPELCVCVCMSHPSLQQRAQQVLPEMLLSAFAQGCSSRGCQEGGGGVSIGDVRAFLQLPAAAASLCAADLKELMQHSILHMDGALLPELVRLPAAAQLLQEDVAALLQAALGRASTAHSSGSGTAVAQAAAAGVLAATAELQHEGLLEAISMQGPAHEPKQQQQGTLLPVEPQQEHHASSAHGPLVVGDPADMPGLLQQCQQHPKAAAHMFQLLTLPWVGQLPACAVKDLLVAAGERQFKGLFNWLLQQPQAPRDDAEVQGHGELLLLSTGAAEADPCYTPEVCAGLMTKFDGLQASDSDSDDDMSTQRRAELEILEYEEYEEWSDGL